MKKHSVLWAILVAAAGCVQPTVQRTVVFTLDVSGVPNVQTAGVRGGGNPLSWEQDLPLTAVVPDSLYTATITSQTAYNFTEIKFTVNGQFELEGKENRKLVFTGDTTFYRAKFNVE